MNILKKEYPRPDKKRDNWYNLNGEWDFSFDEPIYDKKINVPYSWASPLSQIYENKPGTVYYRRCVSWKANAEKIFLCFGAVDYECTVFVNDIKVGEHTGGYIGFDLDVTNAWNNDKENIITAKVTDMGKGENLYGKQSYGDIFGIWQTVWLEGRCEKYIESFYVKTLISGKIQYDINTVNAADGDEISLNFENNHAVGVITDNKAHVEFCIENPNLWSPSSPYLYEGTLTLNKDTVHTYFGIREIGTGIFGKNNNRYITLNGKPCYLNGVLDQAFNPDGYFTYPSDDDCRKEIERLKLIGINMMRIHIKAEEPLKLYWADKLGMLVMEDIPNFWSEPTENARKHYEQEMEEQMLRDYNHPAVFYWVIFNETWGLFKHKTQPDGSDKCIYDDETAQWVISMYHKAKEIDSTRPVEENSTNNHDHTITDVNSWHFYSNGYENVKKEIGDFADNSYVGSDFNFREGYKMTDVPSINSECGNVWGVIGNAGDSDISWQYKYMMNEFRLHDKLGGFVFTEYHDVPNEFNGYFKIDSSDKDFGYNEFGMSLKDLHSYDYLGVDFAPMTTVKPLEELNIPLFVSSFSDKHHGKTLEVSWNLYVKNPLLQNGGYEAACGSFDFILDDYGTTRLSPLSLTMPNDDGLAYLMLTLSHKDKKIMKNCIFFDIQKPQTDILTIAADSLSSQGFKTVINAIDNNKKSGIGSGEFSTTVNVSDIPSFSTATGLKLIFEASSRQPMTHDFENPTGNDKIDIDFMLGYTCDPGENPNSFTQTDKNQYSSKVEVCVDDIPVKSFFLPDCPADSRGLLSHHYQPVDNLLDEAGSYGYLCELKLPTDVFLGLKNKDSFVLTFKTDSGHGLSLFGRNCGRYPIGITLISEE